MPTLLPVSHAICSMTFSVTGTTRPQVITLGCFPGPGLTASQINTNFYDALVVITNAPLAVTNLHTSTTIVSSHCLYNDAGSLFSDTILINAGGSSAGAPVTTQVSPLLKKNTLFAGPKFRGRCFLPSGNLAESNVDQAGIITSSIVSTMNTKWAAAFTSMTVGAGAITPVLIHRSGSPASTPITSLTINPLVATMKKRLRK